MEDSGYYSKRSGQFQFNSGGKREGFIFDDIFDLKFSDINKSKAYRYFRHGFKDEDDFEEFKQDLKDFRKLKEEVREEYEYSDPRRGVKTKTSHRRSRCISGSGRDFPNEPLMEFFNGDEHFQEFERVFDTISSRKRFSTDFDPFRWTGRGSASSNGEGASGGQERSDRWGGMGRDQGQDRGNRASIGQPFEDVFQDLNIDDSFMDFFNNDEDFKEFESELEKFKSNRRSRVLDDIHRRSSCDIFGDVKAFCDRSLDKTTPLSTGTSTSSSTSSQGEASDGESNMWKTAEEWDFVLNKLKRNSRLFLDKGPPPDSDILSDKPVYVHKIRVEGRPEKDDCQYTCHHKCVGSVTLDCTSVLEGQNGEEHANSIATETSLSEPKLRNSPKSKNNVTVSAPSEEVTQRLTPQLSTNHVPGVAQRVDVDSSGDAPANEKDETDSGYRSGTIPDEKLPKTPGQATLNRDELRKKIAEFNHLVPGSEFELVEDHGEAFQGFIKVTLNFVRPITMSLSMRPPSIYDLLTREHIVEQNTQSIAFYMPRDTIKSIHVESTTTTKEVIAALLKKFHILDHPRKFALYEQEFSKNKLLKLKRVADKEFPLKTVLAWDVKSSSTFRLVLQENETGEIVWEGFSRPELQNFLKVLDREEDECVSQLHYKYKVMKRIINQRLKELRKERRGGGDSPS